MKIIRKITSISFIVCMMMSIMPMHVHAAEGRVSFTDLETAAGEEFKIRIRTRIEGANIENANIGSIKMELDYDSSIIRFVSGDDISVVDSTLIIDKTSEVETADIALEATFLALKEAETSITMKSVNVVDTEGESIEVLEGSSSIRIVGGTEVEQTDEQTDEPDIEDTIVTVKGEEYTIVNEFQESSLPLGYVKSKVMYNDKEYTAAKSEVGNNTLVLLTDKSGKADFFQYNTQEQSFSPFVRVNISDTSYIIFTDEPIALDLSEQYVEKTLTISNFVFPTWEDAKNKGFYLIHAYDNSGKLGIYQYDTVQQTYQRFSVPSDLESGNMNKASAIKQIIVNNIVVFAIITAVIFIIMLSIIIVLVIRLWKAKSQSSKYDRESISDIYEKQTPSHNEKDIASEYEDYNDTFEYNTHVEADKEKTEYTQVQNAKYYQENRIFEIHEFEDEVVEEYEDDFENDFEDEFEDEFAEVVEDKFQSEVDKQFEGGFEDDFEDNFDDQFEDDFEDDFKDDFDDEIDNEELEQFEDSEYEFVDMLLEEEPELPKRKKLSFRKGKK